MGSHRALAMRTLRDTTIMSNLQEANDTGDAWDDENPRGNHCREVQHDAPEPKGEKSRRHHHSKKRHHHHRHSSTGHYSHAHKQKRHSHTREHVTDEVEDSNEERRCTSMNDSVARTTNESFGSPQLVPWPDSSEMQMRRPVLEQQKDKIIEAQPCAWQVTQETAARRSLHDGAIAKSPCTWNSSTALEYSPAPESMEYTRASLESTGTDAEKGKHWSVGPLTRLLDMSHVMHDSVKHSKRQTSRSKERSLQ